MRLQRDGEGVRIGWVEFEVPAPQLEMWIWKCGSEGGSSGVEVSLRSPLLLGGN